MSVIMRFEPNTHLPAGLGTLEYSDYRDVGGVKVPFRMGRMQRFERGPLHFVGYEIKQVLFNVPIDKSVFDDK